MSDKESNRQHPNYQECPISERGECCPECSERDCPKRCREHYDACRTCPGCGVWAWGEQLMDTDAKEDSSLIVISGQVVTLRERDADYTKCSGCDEYRENWEVIEHSDATFVCMLCDSLATTQSQ